MNSSILARAAALLCGVALGTGTASGANPPSHDRQAVARGHRPHSDTNCGTQGYAAFLGGAYFNHAGGDYSAVLGGADNLVCDDHSSIAGGEYNSISSHEQDAAYLSFIGAGLQNSTSAWGTVIGGGELNTVNGGQGAVVGGYENAVNGSTGFIGEGQQNVITNAAIAAITSGGSNQIISSPSAPASSAEYAAIDGGYQNTIAALVNGGAEFGFIGAGSNNVVTGVAAAVAGGEKNQAGGLMAAVPGGFYNLANGAASFAAGYGADAATNGSFVWADYSPGAGQVVAKRANVFLARASGGVAFYSNVAQTAGVSLAPGSGTWSSLSDRTMKTGIVPLDAAGILAKVAALPVSEWSYTSERGVRHIGPMAQDFYAAFKVGEDDRHITSIDEDGVALAAVKALHDENASLRRDLRALQRQVAALARR